MRLVALVLVGMAMAGCGSEGTTATGGRERSAENVLSANGCEGLAKELGPGAIPAMQIGDGCTLEVRSHGALRRLGLRSACPEQASILLPFDEVEGGWALDRRELGEIDNGDCL